MIIKIEELEGLVKTADSIFLTEKGEKVLLKLLAIREQVENAVKEAKAKIETAALALDPDFASIQGDKVKISYRAYGSRYAIDDSLANEVPASLVTKKEVVSINTEAVDSFIKANGGLPVGIFEPVRSKTISISVKK